MNKTRWYTEPPEGEHRPVWVTYEDGEVDWVDSTEVYDLLKYKTILAWTGYTPTKPEAYDPTNIALKGWEKPTEEDIYNACVSFDHSYGFMDEENKKRLRFDAKEWLRAWRHTLND